MSHLEKIDYYGCINSRLAGHRCYKPEDEPKIGGDATYLAWSDKYPLTVINIVKEKKYDIVVCQVDASTPAEGHDYFGEQKYTFKPNPNGRIYHVKSYDYIHPEAGKTKVYLEVRWNEHTKRWNKVGGTNIAFGYKTKYEDPSF